MLVACGGEDGSERARAEYIESVALICETYGRQLDEIPPPTDPASPGAVFESIDLALPILREQAAHLKALETPDLLRKDVARFLRLTDESIVKLEQARHQAEERELFLMVKAISAFEKVRDEAKELAQSIGFHC
jgi:hypothetical protein